MKSRRPLAPSSAIVKPPRDPRKRPTDPWGPGELALVQGWEVDGAWFGQVLGHVRATGVVVRKGDEQRIIFFDHKTKQLRSVPYPVVT